MEKTCEDCQHYWEARKQFRNGKNDHPCILPEKVCEKFKLDWNQKVCLKKYPRLVAHLICESLGYFTPGAAANAIAFYKKNLPFFCEWFSHMAQFQPEKSMFNPEAVKRVQKSVIEGAFARRKHHQGYMSDYPMATTLVKREIENPEKGLGSLASWF